ncbi:MAG: 3-hydroxyacyl-CoA dehydrogenase family protein [Nitrososphaeria archaeon]|nr:3-hydroxyacyl-CoA dehydrogenase family protein [Nitrososphaeria archaeon]NIN52918.1 3-hydroxyacyl-CoA dehydrogenase family protein [Nitrososphaeria archaeon]NIQ33477.1 3-hydroxyacyl-CoA dehydrogenase family protein [Nitrososphaeria archaeon]
MKKIGVVGAGAMGHQIADIMALNEKQVIIKDVNMELVNKALRNVEKLLDDLVGFHITKADREIERIEKQDGVMLTEEQKKKIRERLRPTYDEERKKEIMSRIKGTESWDGFRDVDLVVEAIAENIDAKKELFRRLDEICPRHAILATNTSTLSITEIASATQRPQRVIGMHFFNPPVTLPLIEVIAGLETSEETVNDIIDFAQTLRNHRYFMQPICVKETPGFLVNRILGAMLREAFACYEENVASLRDIDLAMKAGAGMPMGPFELADLIGIDILYQVDESMKRMQGGLLQQRPIQIIKRMYYARRWGRKTGRGFYEYPSVETG